MDKIATAYAWIVDKRYRWLTLVIVLAVVAGMLLR